MKEKNLINRSKSNIGNKTLFVINQFYPPDYAPTGQLIKELVTCLGYEGNFVRVFTGQPGYAYQQKEAPRTERLYNLFVQRTRAAQFWPERIRGKLFNGLAFAIRTGIHLLKNLRKGDIVLLTTAPAFLPILGYLTQRLIGINYVCLIYDLYPDVAVTLGVVKPKHWLVKLWNFLNDLTWSNAQNVIVLSDTMKDRILRKHPHLESKITVIHNWADPNWIVPIEKTSNWFAYKHNLLNKFTVLYSGNMGRCHDMTTILRAAEQLQDQPIQFVFIGGGAKFQTSLETAQAWNLQNCLFLPYQDRQDLPYSLTACDLSLVSMETGMEGIVAPSKFYGILATGRPVAAICEQNSYLRQLLAQSGCGQAFESGDEDGLAQFIRSMALQPELAQQMGQAGRRYLTSNFTAEIIAKQYARVLGLRTKVNQSKQDIQERQTVSHS